MSNCELNVFLVLKLYNREPVHVHVLTSERAVPELCESGASKTINQAARRTRVSEKLNKCAVIKKVLF
jgi:hypothetical protein